MFQIQRFLEPTLKCTIFTHVQPHSDDFTNIGCSLTVYLYTIACNFLYIHKHYKQQPLHPVTVVLAVM